MLVTIYTDASYNPKNHKAAGAAWIRSNRGTLRVRKKMKGVSNPTSAEAYIINYAIRYAYSKWPDATVIFVNTDSLNVCKFMWEFNNSEPKNKQLKIIIDYIKKFGKHYQLEYRFKHVKAHTNKKDIRSWLNRWCDQNAKETRKIK